MTFTISIPHRSADESLVDVAGHARHLGQDESRIMRQIVIQARLDGVATTAGQLIDHLERIEPHERRAMLDQARTASGLPTTADVEAVERAAMASEAGRAIAARYGGPTLCHGKTAAGLPCNAIPMTNDGVPRRVDVVAWYCSEHIAQARPGDMDPLPGPFRYSPSGAIISNDPAEAERERHREVSRRAQLASQADDRRVDAAERHASKQARDEARRSELPPHLRELV